MMDVHIGGLRFRICSTLNCKHGRWTYSGIAGVSGSVYLVGYNFLPLEKEEVGFGYSLYNWNNTLFCFLTLFSYNYNFYIFFIIKYCIGREWESN